MIVLISRSRKAFRFAQSGVHRANPFTASFGQKATSLCMSSLLRKFYYSLEADDAIEKFSAPLRKVPRIWT